MLKDKSRLLLFGALILLVLVLMDGGVFIHGFSLFHGVSWLRWVLLGRLIWLITSRCACCRSGVCDPDMEDVESDNEEAAEEEEKEGQE